MVKGDKCWIVENGLRVTPAEVVSFNGNLVLIKTQNGKVLRLPKHRLFESEEKALSTLKKNTVNQKKTPYDYMDWRND